MKKLATVSIALLASAFAASQAQAQYASNPYGTNYGSAPYSANAYAANAYQKPKPQYDNWPNWYVGVSAGMNFMTGDITGGQTGSIDDGWSGTLSLGFRPYAIGNAFTDNLRFEVALGYGTASTSIVGLDTNALTPMFNVFYDFRQGSKLRPYIGAGVGIARVEYEDSNQYFVGFLQEDNPDYDADTDPVSERTRNVLDEAGNPIPVTEKGDQSSDVAFSYQFMTGLSYAPESIPHTEFSMGYRYQATGDLTYTMDRLGTFESEYDAHVVEAGARFRF